jgi:hypothetical protein
LHFAVAAVFDAMNLAARPIITISTKR